MLGFQLHGCWFASTKITLLILLRYYLVMSLISLTLLKIYTGMRYRIPTVILRGSKDHIFFEISDHKIKKNFLLRIIRSWIFEYRIKKKRNSGSRDHEIWDDQDHMVTDHRDPKYVGPKDHKWSHDLVILEYDLGP